MFDIRDWYLLKSEELRELYALFINMSSPNKRRKLSQIGSSKRESSKALFQSSKPEYFKYVRSDLDEDPTFSRRESANNQAEDDKHFEIDHFEPKISIAPLTLYETCLITLCRHSKYIESLTGIPFIPYGADLLRTMNKHESYLEPQLCRALGETFSSAPDNSVDIDVTSLCLKDSNLGIENFQFIQSIGGILTRLNLNRTSVSDDDMRYLTWMINLRVLDLSQTRISNRGLLLLTTNLSLEKAHGGLVSLQALNLAATEVSSLSIRHLLKFPALVMFDLSGTRADKLSLSMACRRWKFIPESVSVFCCPSTENKEAMEFITKEISLEKLINLTNRPYIENTVHRCVIGSNAQWQNRPLSFVPRRTLAPILRMYRKLPITNSIKPIKPQSTPKLRVANEQAFLPSFSPHTIFIKTRNKPSTQKLTLSAALRTSDRIQNFRQPTQPIFSSKPLGKIAPKRSHQLSFFNMDNLPKCLESKKPRQEAFRNPFMA